MELQLQDKVAVVTGASKGIGLAVATALAAEGARVVVGSRTTTHELQRLSEHGVVVETVDLASAEGPGRVVERAVSRFGGIDLLVNNVGGVTPRLGGFLSITDQDWLEGWNLNLMTAVRASRAALPSLVERRGSIVNISSINARLPQAPVTDYAAAKAAMTNLGKPLAEEFGPQGVRVNTISPGPVRTGIWEGEGGYGHTLAAAMAGGDHAGFLQGFPGMAGMTIGRFTEPNEVADLVLLLASPRNGSVTGSDWVIDGGMLKSY